MMKTAYIFTVAVVAAALSGCAPAASQMFEQRINSDDVTVRREAAKELRGKPRDVRVVPYILQACRDPDADVRVYGYYAIGRADARVEGVVGAILEGMADTSVQVRRALASSLGMLDPFPNTCLPHMVRMLIDPDEKTRSLVASAFVDLENGGIGSLMRNIDSKDAKLRLAVIDVLAQIGAPAKSALPKLKQIAGGDADAEARAAAEKAVKFIER